MIKNKNIKKDFSRTLASLFVFAFAFFAFFVSSAALATLRPPSTGGTCSMDHTSLEMSAAKCRQSVARDPVCGVRAPQDNPACESLSDDDFCMEIIVEEKRTFENACELNAYGGLYIGDGSCEEQEILDYQEVLERFPPARFLESSTISSMRNTLTAMLEDEVERVSPRFYYAGERGRIPGNPQEHEGFELMFMLIKENVFDLFSDGHLSAEFYALLTDESGVEDMREKLIELNEELETELRRSGGGRDFSNLFNQFSSGMQAAGRSNPLADMAEVVSYRNHFKRFLRSQGFIKGILNQQMQRLISQYFERTSLWSVEDEHELKKFYLIYTVELISQYLQEFASSAAGEGGNCNVISCDQQSDLVCATDPTVTPPEQTCARHSDCHGSGQSGVCLPPNNEGERFCEARRTCFMPQPENADCSENPVCGQGTSCISLAPNPGIGGRAGESCSGDSACISGNCEGGVCVEVLKCMSCYSFGEIADGSGACCPGAVKLGEVIAGIEASFRDQSGDDDPFAMEEDGLELIHGNLEPNLCVQPVPESIDYSQFISDIDIILPLEDEDEQERTSGPINFRSCEFDWYQAYLEQITKDSPLFERKMAMFAMEFMNHGPTEDGRLEIDDFWQVNQNMHKLAIRNRQVRRAFFQALRADISNHQQVRENARAKIEQLVTRNILNARQANNYLLQIDEILNLKVDTLYLCLVVNGANPQGRSDVLSARDRLRAQFEDIDQKEVTADGLEAIDLVRAQLRVERNILEMHHNLFIEPIGLELNQLKQRYQGIPWFSGVQRESVANVSWHVPRGWVSAALAVTGVVAFVVGAALGPLGAVVGTLAYIAFAGVAIDMDQRRTAQGAVVDVAHNIYTAMWGKGVDQADQPMPYIEAHRVWRRAFRSRYRLDLYWPKSECRYPGARRGSGTEVYAVPASCIRHFAFLGENEHFKGLNSLIDPPMGHGIQKSDLLSCGANHQREFVDLVNEGKDRVVNHYTGSNSRSRRPRENSALSDMAVALAFPEISQGNYMIDGLRKNYIMQRATEYFEQEFQDFEVNEVFKHRWSEYAFYHHFVFPSFGDVGNSIGYPRSGLIPYMIAMELASEFASGDVDRSRRGLDYADGKLAQARHRAGGAYSRDHDVTMSTQGDGGTPESRAVDVGDFDKLSDFQTSGAASLSAGDANLVSDDSLGAGEAISGADGLDSRGLSGASQAISDRARRGRDRIETLSKMRKKRTENLNNHLKDIGIDPSLIARQYGNYYQSALSPALPFDRESMINGGADGQERSSTEQRVVPQRDHSADQGHQVAPTQRIGQRQQRRSSPARQQSSEAELAQRQIESSAQSVDRNAHRYMTDEQTDNLFDIVTKTYFRNYNRLLDRRTRRDEQRELEFAD